MPEGRRERMLAWLLEDQSQVLRLLLLLLADSPEEGVEALLPGGRDRDGAAGLRAWGERQIFESLLRCLDRGPERLDEVARRVIGVGNGEQRLDMRMEEDDLAGPIGAAGP